MSRSLVGIGRLSFQRLRAEAEQSVATLRAEATERVRRTALLGAVYAVFAILGLTAYVYATVAAYFALTTRFSPPAASGILAGALLFVAALGIFIVSSRRDTA